jgi:WD40 repeat protein
MVAVAPGGRTVARAARGELSIQAVPDGARRVLRGHGGAILDLSFTADGSALVTASRDGTVRRWPVDPRRLTFGAERGTTFWFVRAGASILTNEKDGRIRLIDVETEESIILVEPTPLREWTSVSVISGGSTVALAEPGNRIFLIDVRNARQRELTLKSGELPTVVMMLPWERYVVALAPDGVHVIDSEGNQRLFGGAGARSLGRSADGKTIVSYGPDGRIQVWYPFAETTAGRTIEHGETPSDVAVSADGTSIAATRGNEVLLYDVQRGTRRDLGGLETAAIAVDISPDGRHVAASSMDGSVRIWSGESDGAGRALGVHQGPVRRLRFGPDGARLVTAGDGDVRLWDVDTGAGRRLVVDGPVDEARFSPDGLWIAVLAGGRIRLFSDDLPTNPRALREWIEQATTVRMP